MKSFRKLIPLFLVLALLGTSCGSGIDRLNVAGHIGSYKNTTFNVDPFSAWVMVIDMNRGDVFEGYLIVRGGNDDIKFYIKDPYGNKVLDAGWVYSGYDFHYIATSEGLHTAEFDNSWSWLTSKVVSVNYRVR